MPQSLALISPEVVAKRLGLKPFGSNEYRGGHDNRYSMKLLRASAGSGWHLTDWSSSDAPPDQVCQTLGCFDAEVHDFFSRPTQKEYRWDQRLIDAKEIHNHDLVTQWVAAYTGHSDPHIPPDCYMHPCAPMAHVIKPYTVVAHTPQVVVPLYDGLLGTTVTGMAISYYKIDDGQWANYPTPDEKTCPQKRTKKDPNRKHIKGETAVARIGERRAPHLIIVEGYTDALQLWQELSFSMPTEERNECQIVAVLGHALLASFSRSMVKYVDKLDFLRTVLFITDYADKSYDGQKSAHKAATELMQLNDAVVARKRGHRISINLFDPMIIIGQKSDLRSFARHYNNEDIFTRINEAKVSVESYSIIEYSGGVKDLLKCFYIDHIQVEDPSADLNSIAKQSCSALRETYEDACGDQCAYCKYNYLIDSPIQILHTDEVLSDWVYYKNSFFNILDPQREPSNETDFDNVHAHRQGYGKTGVTKASRVFVENQRGRKVEGVTSEPHGGLLIEIEGQLYLNRFSPWAIQPIKDPTPEYLASARKLWDPYFRVTDAIYRRAFDPITGEIVPTAGMANWVNMHRAYWVQHPFENTQLTLLVRSIEGVGKDATLQPFMYIVGEHNSFIVSNNAVNEQYNDWLTKALIVFDEVVMTAGNVTDLKTAMTNSRGSVRSMYQMPRMVTFCNYMEIHTNAKKPIQKQALEGTRRLVTFLSGMTKEEKQAFDDDGTFNELHELPFLKIKSRAGQLVKSNKPNLEALTQFVTLFHQMDTTNYNPRSVDIPWNCNDKLVQTVTNPVLEALQNMIENSEGPMQNHLMFPFMELTEHCHLKAPRDQRLPDATFQTALVQRGFKLLKAEWISGKQIQTGSIVYQAAEKKYWQNSGIEFSSSRHYRDCDPRSPVVLKFVCYFYSKEAYASQHFVNSPLKFHAQIDRRRRQLEALNLDPKTFSIEFVKKKKVTTIRNAATFYALMDMFADDQTFISRMFFKYGWSRMGYGDNPERYNGRHQNTMSLNTLIESMKGSKQMVGHQAALDL